MIAQSSSLRCPECGHDVADRTLPKPQSLFHWRITVPGFVVLAAIATLVYLFAKNSQTLQAGSGVPAANVIDPAFTLAQVKMIAAGEASDHSLLRAVIAEVERSSSWTSSLPGDPVVSTGFVSGRGMRRATLSFGWPSQWHRRITHSLYDDALTRTGFRTMRTQTPQDRSNVVMPPGLASANASLNDESGLVWPRQRWSWMGYGAGTLAFRPTPEETRGRVVWHDFLVHGVVSALGFVVVAWAAPTVLLWAVSLGRGRSKPRWRARWLRWGCPTLAVAFIIWQTATSAGRSDSFSARTTFGTFVQIRPASGAGAPSGFFTTPGIEHTSIRASQLPAIASRADAEQVVAQAILDVVKDQPKDEDYLAVSVTPEVVVESGSSTLYCSQVPIIALRSTKYIRRSDIGPPESLANPAGTSWKFSNSYVQKRTSTGDPNDDERGWSINLGAIGTVAVGLWLLWLASALVCRALAAFIARRRRHRHECIACGYVLTPPTAA